MTAVFLRILEMGLTASVVVAAVCLLRLFTGKVSKKMTCLLWVLVAVRLLCPFTLQSPTSVMPAPERVEERITAVLPTPAPVTPRATFVPYVPHTAAPVTPAVTPVTPAATPAPAAPAATPFPWLTLAAAVWGAGVVAMLLYAVLSSAVLKHRLRGAVRREGNVYESERVFTPFLLGMVRPRIYLPFHMDDATRAAVLSHENAHIRRGDHLVKPFAWLLLSVYWFNPLLWLSYFLLARDIELACDEKVAATLSESERRDYASALLSCGVKRSRRLTVCPLAFGAGDVKARVKSVMNYKRPAFWLILAVAAALIVAAVCLLTDPLSLREQPAAPEPTATPVPTATPAPTPTVEPTVEPTEEPSIEAVEDFSWLEEENLVKLGTVELYAADNNYAATTADLYRLGKAERALFHAGEAQFASEWFTPTDDIKSRFIYDRGYLCFICDRPILPDGTKNGESKVLQWCTQVNSHGLYYKLVRKFPVPDGVVFASAVASTADFPCPAVRNRQGDVYFRVLEDYPRDDDIGVWEYAPREKGTISYDAENYMFQVKTDRETILFGAEDAGITIYRKKNAEAGTVSCTRVGKYSNDTTTFAIRDNAGTDLFARDGQTTLWTKHYPQGILSASPHGSLLEDDEDDPHQQVMVVSLDNGAASETVLMNMADGRVLWRHSGIALTNVTTNSGWGEPTDITGFYGVYGNDVYRLDPQTGKTVWKTTVKKSDETVVQLCDAFGGYDCYTENAGQTVVTLMKLDPKTGKITARQTERAPDGVKYVYDRYDCFREAGGTERVRHFWYSLLTKSWLTCYYDTWDKVPVPTTEELLAGPRETAYHCETDEFYVTADGKLILHIDTAAKTVSFTAPDGTVKHVYELALLPDEDIFRAQNGDIYVGGYSFEDETFFRFTADGVYLGRETTANLD